MNAIITNLSKLFSTLQEYPERKTEIGLMIKDLLNNNFSSCTCDKVFISNGSETSTYVTSVIPTFPSTSNILEVQFLKNYDIDINTHFFKDDGGAYSFDPLEYAVWLLHELFANIITDTTFLRYKRNIIKFYDVNNTAILNTIKVYGNLAKIGIFSRTAKSYISGTSMDTPVNQLLSNFGVGDIWNSILNKYICKLGGSYNVISSEYIDRMDRTEFRLFNEIARKYTGYVIKYNNTDYYTLIKYLIAETGSDLIKFYCEKEPTQIVTFQEKDVYNLFDDRKLLRDTDTEGINYVKEKTIPEFQNEFNELKSLYKNNTSSENLLSIVKARDLYNEISTRLSMQGDRGNEFLVKLKCDIISFIETMKKNGYDENKVSIMDYNENV